MAKRIANTSSQHGLVFLSMESSLLESVFNASVFQCTHLDISLRFITLQPLMFYLIFMNSIHLIDLVTDKNNGYLVIIITSRLNENLPPFLKVLIGLCLRDVKDQDATITPSVER